MKRKWNLQNPTVRKQLATLLSLTLVMLCFVGTTLAYVIAKAGPLTNRFQPVEVSCEVSADQKQVTNNSGVPVYLRIAVTATFEKTEMGQTLIHWKNPDLTITPGENWVKVGDFYYFKGAVDPNAIVALPAIVTGGTVDGYTAVTRVMAEVIQSEPDDAVQGAWKMTYNGTIWSNYDPG